MPSKNVLYIYTHDHLFGLCSWLMPMYARDILSRLPQLFATCTAIFGSALKIDSTEKVYKKLEGSTAGSASWCYKCRERVGRGASFQVSILTESERLEGLQSMAYGLVKRFA